MHLYPNTEQLDLSTRTCGVSLTLKEERRLRVFENRVLKRIFGPKKDEVRGNRETYIMRSLMIFIPHPVLFGQSNGE
jgi:hypothetical protein